MFLVIVVQIQQSVSSYAAFYFSAGCLLVATLVAAPFIRKHFRVPSIITDSGTNHSNSVTMVNYIQI